MTSSLDFTSARQRMVEQQLVQRGLRNAAVLNAMRDVPREMFVAEEKQQFAYADGPIPIGHGQTISQPFVVAAMIAAADIKSADHVLEVGAGSGYAAAVMSRIAAGVYAVERHEELATSAACRLSALGYDNVHVRAGDGTLGWPEHAPFDVIIVSAGGPSVPASLREQLRVGGRLIMPVGIRFDQRLVKITRAGADQFEERDLGSVAFVPLIGAEGWPEYDQPTS